jgi:hypothetical protein
VAEKQSEVEVLDEKQEGPSEEIPGLTSRATGEDEIQDIEEEKKL